VASCPDETYTVGTNCVACNSPCKRCASATECIDCITSPSVYKLVLSTKVCVADCPAKTYVKNGN